LPNPARVLNFSFALWVRDNNPILVAEKLGTEKYGTLPI
jgi:hypothetical protein